MRNQILITFAVVILIVVAIVSGCVCTYASNQTEIQRGVERLLDDRINEYVERNKTEFVASLTPVIGANGNWWIGDTDTGCPVMVEGQPGMSAYAIAVANGFQGTEIEWLNSLQGSNGADGQTPYIGENGNWWIGDTDTSISVNLNADIITSRAQVTAKIYHGDSTNADYINLNVINYQSGAKVLNGRFSYGDIPANAYKYLYIEFPDSYFNSLDYVVLATPVIYPGGKSNASINFYIDSINQKKFCFNIYNKSAEQITNLCFNILIYDNASWGA